MLNRQQVFVASKLAFPEGRSAQACTAPSTRSTKPTRFASIQCLRAVAALSVVVFHAIARAGHPVVIGAWGVDVFFIISGFVMVMVTNGRSISSARFLLERMARIAPAYWGVTLAIAALAVILPASMPRMHASFGHVGLSLLFVPHADPSGTFYPVLVSGWTLTYEAGFYLVWAAALTLEPSFQVLAATAMLGALVAAGLLLAPDGAALRTYTNPLLLEFAAGLWLGTVTIRGRLPSRAWGAGLLSAGVAAFMAQTLLPLASEDWRLLLWGCPAVLVVAGLLSLEAYGATPFASHRGLGAMLALGDASYGISLLNGLVVSTCARLLPGAGALALAAVSVVASVAAGMAFYHGVDRPMTRTLRRLLHRTAS